MSKLETPSSAEELYTARAGEVDEHRPRFTGDICHIDEGASFVLLQHPCAMRRGPRLEEKQLVAGVSEFGNGIPADWNSGHFRRMFFPELFQDGRTWSADFSAIQILSAEQVENAERVAILSQIGVNLLMQRWVHHNTRVVVPTITINDTTAGPFEEADLVGESMPGMLGTGISRDEALAEMEDWFSSPMPGGTLDLRVALGQPQARSSVRRMIRARVREREHSSVP